MGIFDRLGSVINSYINDIGGELPFRKEYSRSGDSDYNAAYDELNDYLNGHKSGNKSNNSYSTGSRTASIKIPPDELRADFECLGVAFGADELECKTAYKNLLKIHHPDRHAGHEGNFKKATERSMKINAAWDRIEKWRKS